MTSQNTKNPGDPTLEGWEQHWEFLKRFVDMRAAACVFAIVATSLCFCLSFYSKKMEDFCYSMHISVYQRDWRKFNSFGNFLLQDHLKGKPASDTKECAILGASFVAATREPRTEKTTQAMLEKRLAELTGEKWRCVTLAASANVTWCYFYEARLLRKYRPPDVMIVSLDGQDARVRNLHLVLEAGVRRGDLSARELAFAVPYNRQALYVCEADLKKWLRDNFAFFRAWNYATYSFPMSVRKSSWYLYTWATLKGVTPPVVYPSTLYADGAPKPWMEIPDNRARIELMKKDGHKLYWDDKLPAELELLFDELDRCREQGIRVILTSMPLNPAVPQYPGRLGEYVRESAARHRLAFHDYWTSGIVPTEYYFDNGHFFGEGCRIMADELAKLIVAGEEEETR